MTRQEEKQKAAEDYIKSDAVGIGNEILAFGDFLNGADWADKTMIDKACEWLNIHDSYSTPTNVLVENFRKAMEK